MKTDDELEALASAKTKDAWAKRVETEGIDLTPIDPHPDQTCQWPILDTSKRKHTIRMCGTSAVLVVAVRTPAAPYGTDLILCRQHLGQLTQKCVGYLADLEP